MFRRNPSYIGIYDNALTKKECQRLIQLFEENPIKNTGITGAARKNNLNAKQDIEIDCHFNDGKEITEIVARGLKSSLDKYYKTYANGLNGIGAWQVDTVYNFQKYELDDDGYKVWHTEHGYHEYCNKRILAWMIYLNNAKGTEFRYYPTVAAKEGRCIIWPAGWTHMHKSQPNKGLKYLVTGWASVID